MRKVYQIAILFLIIFLLFSNHVLGNSDLKMPNVYIALREVTFNLPTEESAILDVMFIIHNPNDINITLIGIYYKIYINGKFVDEKIYIPNPTTLEFLTILPHETKIEKYNPVIYLSSVDEETRNIILEGHGEWSFEGTAVFSTTPGSLLGDLKVPIITEKTKVRYWGYKFPLPVNLSKITIEVRDEKWNPIIGANVILISKEISYEDLTNASGAVEFEVPTTNYTIRVSKEGYIAHEEPLELSVPSTVMRTIHLYPASKLIVEVKDGRGRPIENATITLSSKDFGNFTKITNASGIAEFEIPRANYIIKALKKDYLPYEETLNLSEVATSTKVIQLKLPFWQEYQFYIIGIVVFFIATFIAVLLLKRKR